MKDILRRDVLKGSALTGLVGGTTRTALAERDDDQGRPTTEIERLLRQIESSPQAIQLKSMLVCGTRVLTPNGETRVEDLRIGNLVVTENGVARPIRWVGRQSFKKSPGSRWHGDVVPVRISRFALDDGSPHTDLYLSPGHMLFIDCDFIPAKYLINGASIVQAMPEEADEIEYFNIELETHDVIFAEGVAVETLLVTNRRELFTNLIEYERLYGSDSDSTMVPCAPIAGYNGGRSELKALLRRAVYPIADVRDPIQVAYDRFATRAFEIASKHSSFHLGEYTRARLDALLIAIKGRAGGPIRGARVRIPYLVSKLLIGPS